MIVPMKKAMLVVLREDRDAITEALQRCGELMPIPPENYAPDADTSGEAVRAAQALQTLRPYREKKGMFAPRPEATVQELQKPDADSEALVAQIEKITAEADEALAEKFEIEKRMAELTPWIRMDIPVEALCGTRTTAIYSGYIDPRRSDRLWDEAEKRDGVVFQLDTGPMGAAILVYVHREDAEPLLEALTEIGFSQAPPACRGLPRDAINELMKELQKKETEYDSLQKQLRELAAKGENIELLCDQLGAEQERTETPYGETVQTVYLEGWVRSDRTDRLKKALDKVTDCYDLTFADPAENDNPPTVTKNNRFISQFETITDMFSRPKNGELDPNPVMGVWYWLIFGLMMGDAGYGVMMLVLIGLFKKLMKPRGDMAKLVNVLFFSSFTTIFWGIVFGSYFGETWHPLLFAPLDDPMAMLVFCMILGVLHIFSGMAVKIADNVRKGQIWDAIFDQVSWMLLLTGLGLLFLQQTRTVGMILAITGAAIVLLTAGRAKKGIFGKITGGFGGLYNITSYMSDILSYSRILALSLATGVVGMVMNLLAGMIQGSVFGFICSLLIYAVGHIFNLAMGLLSAYVHDSRLQYIEFFNKFYEGGGYAFRPLQINPRFVDVTETREN